MILQNPFQEGFSSSQFFFIAITEAMLIFVSLCYKHLCASDWSSLGAGSVQMGANPQAPTGGAMWLQWGQIQSQRAVSCVCPALHVCKHPCELFRWCLHAADWIKWFEQDLAPPHSSPVLWWRWRSLLLLLLRRAHKTPADSTSSTHLRLPVQDSCWDQWPLTPTPSVTCSIYRWVLRTNFLPTTAAVFFSVQHCFSLLRRK